MAKSCFCLFTEFPYKDYTSRRLKLYIKKFQVSDFHRISGSPCMFNFQLFPYYSISHLKIREPTEGYVHERLLRKLVENKGFRSGLND